MANEVKITVIKKMSTKDVYGDNPPCQLSAHFIPECDRLNVGDEFIAPADGSFPEGFCAWAFADIHRDITHIRLGGSFGAMEEKGIQIACCTDGLRPVFFKLEAID